MRKRQRRSGINQRLGINVSSNSVAVTIRKLALDIQAMAYFYFVLQYIRIPMYCYGGLVSTLGSYQVPSHLRTYTDTLAHNNAYSFTNAYLLVLVRIYYNAFYIGPVF